MEEPWPIQFLIMFFAVVIRKTTSAGPIWKKTIDLYGFDFFHEGSWHRGIWQLDNIFHGYGYFMRLVVPISATSFLMLTGERYYAGIAVHEYDVARRRLVRRRNLYGVSPSDFTTVCVKVDRYKGRTVVERDRSNPKCPKRDSPIIYGFSLLLGVVF